MVAVDIAATSPHYLLNLGAGMAKLVDARDLKSLGALLRAGSIPALGTNINSTIVSH
jgi:hypothetical protein